MQSLGRRRGRVNSAAVLATVLAGLAVGISGTLAQAASWHLDASFGKHGVAGLPVREGGYDHLYAPGPGDQGALLAAGPQGSVFVGGYAHSKPGAFLVARMSAQGKLSKSFGDGGLMTVPAIYSLPEQPPRMLALSGGGLLIVGLDRAHQLVVVRLSSRGQQDHAFGHDGVAQYTLANTHGHAIIAGVSVEPNGDILAGYFRSEVPQPVNQPMITHGLGVGPLEFVRLLPSGSLDASFGQAGFLTATGAPPATGEVTACDVTITADGSALLAYEQAYVPNGNGSGFPAIQELGSAGTNTAGFGDDGVAYLSVVPVFEGVDTLLCGGLFALANGEVEASFGGGGELFRFTSTGAPTPTFGTAGHTSAGPRALDLTVASDGETFTLDSAGMLTVGGTLSTGAPDPALGGKMGMRFPAKLPRVRPDEQQQVVELLPTNGGLYILVGESIMRLEE
jgi:hypothetical protein